MLPITPHSEFRSPNSRAGVTLAEVLISMAILAIGLLGAAAMFPVGGYFMQKGEIADRGAAIAQAAFADLVARGDLSPEKWRVRDNNNSTYASMGGYARNWVVANADNVNFQKDMNIAAGFVYIIDPLGTAGGVRSGISRSDMGIAPARRLNTNMPPVTTLDTTRWNQFSGDWPVRRLCTPSMVVNSRVPSEPIAQRIYSSSDDIAFNVDDKEVPTRTRMVGRDNNNDGTPETAFARESRGDYSWMAMVAPTTSDARLALALDPSAHYYDVSVVVFYKRPINNISTTELLVNGYIVSTGTGGGEILLDSSEGDSAFQALANTAYKDDLKQGQWVLVSGPHPSSTPEKPLFFAQWYRVLVIDDEPDNSELGSTGVQFSSVNTQRRIGLRGPDWPWENVGAPVRVGLFPGAVAVHTKTMRLESFGSYQ